MKWVSEVENRVTRSYANGYERVRSKKFSSAGIRKCCTDFERNLWKVSKEFADEFNDQHSELRLGYRRQASSDSIVHSTN